MSTDRRYNLKARAERQAETRRRIVAATASLHEEVGPARTTVAEIARRAGVQRLTVYNHFPELTDLLAACQGHFLDGHPPPDVVPRERDDVTLEGLENALRGLYTWFRANQAMERNVQRDRDLVPQLDALMRTNADPLFDRAASVYAEALAPNVKRRRAVRLMVRVAMEFRTWLMAAESGLRDVEIARLFAAAVGCAGAGRQRQRR